MKTYGKDGMAYQLPGRLRIGILTTHDELNPGAFLQAYALYKFLTNNYFDVTMINHKTVEYVLKEYKTYFVSINPKFVISSLIKYAKFRKEQKKMRTTGLLLDVNMVNKINFDIIILGSDEIWNFKNCIGATVPAFYGYKLNCKRLISYATSFGSVNLSDVFPDYVIKGIRRISSVSVRDYNSQHILMQKFGITAPVVLDPTFLYEFTEESKEKESNSYLVVYGSFEPAIQKQILKISENSGKTVISLFWHNKHLKNIIVSPFEFIDYIKKAALVITDKYHGVIFSIKYRKPFLVRLTDYRANKLRTIIDLLGLQNSTFYSPDDLFRKIDNEIDYETVYKILKDKIEFSKRFLLERISD